MIVDLEGKSPQLGAQVFVAPSADVIGDVSLGSHCSVWYQAVLRGDNDRIVVGQGTNIQDGVVIHVDPGKPCEIGKDCVIGHRAVLHGCRLGDGVLVGIGAIVLNGADIPDGCLIGAGALVAENKALEPGCLYLGVPARKVRSLRDDERGAILKNAAGYKARAQLFLQSAEPSSE